MLPNGIASALLLSRGYFVLRGGVWLAYSEQYRYNVFYLSEQAEGSRSLIRTSETLNLSRSPGGLHVERFPFCESFK
ncbi:uncharacterized protein MYCFIDRAFT_175395 [Pseudocercospora fijiensis CIRAD86]|uniref:Uncharacterized protein n=1 Tax=Pseudocercospora fijiensis (strain CIRAD86) TaxID=383855 RepID=M2ZRZ0_PSEFD|nr:uncharacterized protein MYCFIDRAFT_175395 [Pseudocercospora fijiensis CIRAD86]EME81804.1 hypothetical protein MYCFIDRAFT_175395 [Pseudocercospora fijiensis CIRAD86]